jgi:inorganic pyrophosphatase
VIALQRPTAAQLTLASPSPTNIRPSSTFSALTQSPANNTKTSSQSRTAQIARHFSSLNSSLLNTSSRLPTGKDSANMAPQYTVRKIAPANTLEHRIYIEKDGVPVSPFHDIPLYANEQQTILNMVVEIPRWTNGKLEVSR